LHAHLPERFESWQSNGAHQEDNDRASELIVAGGNSDGIQILLRTATAALAEHPALYHPQLTSVLSIVNRLTGVLLSIAAIALVIWLLAAAAGPQAYAVVQAVLASRIGQVILFGCTFAFFLHFFSGIRHLVWDTVHGLELRTI
jgi:succinate dehydrogenase / fumarate reductase cytochrome b subunit